MDKETALQRINELRERIEELNQAYYVLDQPLLTDADYDLLMQELKALESEFPEYYDANSPSQRVGGAVSSDLPPVEHLYPMLSLNDVFSEAEVLVFLEKILTEYPDAEFTVEEKIDGLSLAFRYRDGKFDLAHTRGDGHHYGENVTAAASQLAALPLNLPEPLPVLHIRSEVYMPFSEFEKVNEERMAAGEELFANPRNSASGTMRQLDSSLVSKRGLRYFSFDITALEGKSFSRDSEAMAWLAEQGFTVLPNITLCRNVEEVTEAIHAIAERRASLPYAIDGAVVKIDQLEIREKLGQTSKVPRWAVAYKYPPEIQETLLEDIRVQVGRTGRVTPLAVLTPVRISGSTVSRASLHNFELVKQLDARPGDYVYLSKSGDVIPHIVKVNHAKREAQSEAWQAPSNCPVCGAELVRIKDSVDLYCSGSNCPAQAVAKIIYFASKPAMDISGLGEQSVERLYEHDYLHGIEDIYKLEDKAEELIENGLIGREKRVGQLISAINLSKENDLWRLICGLGIRHVGPQAAQKLASAFGSMEKIAAAEKEDLLEVSDIGTESAEFIYAYFRQEQSLALLEELKQAGLNFNALKQEHSSAQNLAGLNIVVTGTLENYSRDEIKDILAAKGAKVKSAVSSATDVLICGEAAGSKLAKAEELGIRIIRSAELEEFLEG